jgi:uncharacterized membrane protein
MTSSFLRAATLLVASVIWAAALVIAPRIVSQVADDTWVLRASAVVYALGGVICHQRPERSFRCSGVQVPVCARCEGLYLAAPFGIAGLMVVRRRCKRVIRSRSTWRWMILAASSLTVVTLMWEWTTGEVTSNVVRAIAGGVLGAAVAAAVTAVVVGDLR